MKLQKSLRTIIIILFILILIPAIFFIKIPYTINGHGILYPSMEWCLEKASDGTIINTLKNNLNNTIPSYSATEFQRGDHVVFVNKNEQLINRHINAGDTLGVISSHLERFKLLELKGDLQEKLRLKEVTLTGEAPERIRAAEQEMIKAQTDFDAEQRLYQRANILRDQDVISEEEYELALNSYNLKKQEINIARANYDVAMAGSKQEEVNRIDAIIDAINEQIENINKRLDAFNIVSPISGILSPGIPPASIETEILARVMQYEQMVLLVPIELSKLKYVQEGMTITITDEMLNKPKGKVIFIDNETYDLNRRQAVFIGSLFENSNYQFKPNQKVQASIEYGKISIAKHIEIIAETIYRN